MANKIHPNFDFSRASFRRGDIIHLQDNWEIARFGQDSFRNLCGYRGAIAVAQSHHTDLHWPYRFLSPYGIHVLKYDQQKGSYMKEVRTYVMRHRIPNDAYFVVTHPGGNAWNKAVALDEDIPHHSYYPVDEDGELEQENWRYLPYQASLCEADGKLIDTVRILFDMATKENPKGISIECFSGRSQHMARHP